MTFDNEEELHKIKYINPSAKLVLRILADDPTATCNVSFSCMYLNDLLLYKLVYSLVSSLVLKLILHHIYCHWQRNLI